MVYQNGFQVMGATAVKPAEPDATGQSNAKNIT